MRGILAAAGVFLFLIRVGSGTETLVFQEKFNNGLNGGGWTTVDLAGSGSLWHKITYHPMDTVSYHSPDTSWWCGVEADTFYPNYLTDALEVNKICDLTGKTNPVLKFWHFLDIDNDSEDSAMVDVSTDSGNTWQSAVGVWTTRSNKWLQVSVNLSAFIGSSVRFRFRFISDSYNVEKRYGWFIDDILLADITSETTEYSNTFEHNSDFTTYNVIGATKWAKSTTRSHSADTSFHSPLVKSTWSCLQTAKIDMSSLQAPVLKFYQYYRFWLDNTVANWSNGGIVEVTTDTTVAAAAWVKLYPVGGYPAYCTRTAWNNPLGNMALTGDADVQGYYGRNEVWHQVQFDLGAYAGNANVWIRFSAGTDAYGFDQEWYIDDVTIIEQGQTDTIYFCDMEDSNDVKFSSGGSIAGNWWRSAHNGFVQKDGSKTYYSADTAAYCGNQASSYGKGAYVPTDNDNALLDNALVSPFMTVGTGTDLKLYMRNRRYAIFTCLFIVDARTGTAGVWAPVDTFTNSTISKGVTGAWLPETIDLSGFAGSDSLAVRFRMVTGEPVSRMYWYLDDIRVIASSGNLADFAEITADVKSYMLTEKSDTFRVFSIDMFDAGATAPGTVFVTLNGIAGSITADDFRPISDDLMSGISLFDSSGTRIPVNVSQSGWNGLTAKLVLNGGTTVPGVPVAKKAYRVKMRTSAKAADGDGFSVTMSAGQSLKTLDNENAGTGTDIATGTFTVTNSLPATPAFFTAVESADSTRAALRWNKVVASDLAGYGVFRDTTAGFIPGTGNLVAAVAVPDTVYADSALTMGVTYYYRVAAFDSGAGAGTVTAEETVVTNTLPVAPTGIIIYEDPGEEYISVQWNTIPGDIVSYWIYRDVVSGFTAGPGKLLATVAAPDTMFSDSSVIVGNIYYYLISAVDDAGGEGPVSGQVDSPVPVELMSFMAVQSGEYIVLSWRTSSETDNLGWNIFRRIDGNSAERINSSLIPGGGTTGSIKEYRYNDFTGNVPGEYFYTLSQVDFSGMETIVAEDDVAVVSGAASVNASDAGEFAGGAFNMVLMNGAYFFTVPENSTLNIYDANGTGVWTYQAYSSEPVCWNGISADGNESAKGVYFVLLRHNGRTNVVKILK